MNFSPLSFKRGLVFNSCCLFVILRPLYSTRGHENRFVQAGRLGLSFGRAVRRQHALPQRVHTERDCAVSSRACRHTPIEFCFPQHRRSRTQVLSASYSSPSSCCSIDQAKDTTQHKHKTKNFYIFLSEDFNFNFFFSFFYYYYKPTHTKYIIKNEKVKNFRLIYINKLYYLIRFIFIKDY